MYEPSSYKKSICGFVCNYLGSRMHKNWFLELPIVDEMHFVDWSWFYWPVCKLIYCCSFVQDLLVMKDFNLLWEVCSSVGFSHSCSLDASIGWRCWCYSMHYLLWSFGDVGLFSSVSPLWRSLCDFILFEGFGYHQVFSQIVWSSFSLKSYLWLSVCFWQLIFSWSNWLFEIACVGTPISCLDLQFVASIGIC